jgi:hypothetical protein
VELVPKICPHLSLTSYIPEGKLPHEVYIRLLHDVRILSNKMRLIAAMKTSVLRLTGCCEVLHLVWNFTSVKLCGMKFLTWYVLRVVQTSDEV